MTDPVKIGIVGAGAIAQTYAEALRQLPEGELSGIADTRVDAARALADGRDCPAFGSLEELLLESGVDAAIVCTPPNTHETICRTLLNAGKAVLCEKPLCVRSDEVEELIALARRDDLLFTMATKFRFVDDVLTARSMVKAGLVGEVMFFENAFTARVDMRNRWNSREEISGGGVLIDNGTHSVDLVRHFLGPIRQVQAIEGPRIQDIPVEDSVQLWTQTDGGVIGTVDLSWSLNKELESYVQIHGSAGTIRVGWRQSMYKQTSSRDWVTFGSGYAKLEAFRNQLRNFCRAFRGVEEVLVSPEDALASVKVIEAAYESMHSNNWIALESVEAV